jgi:hypothetical protein
MKWHEEKGRGEDKHYQMAKASSPSEGEVG